ncbi:MAG: methylenetetrahydrofolate reductase [NAD(P)H] [Parvularculaceae bacterium]
MKNATMSFEVFPPKTAEGADRLISVADALARLSPDFISVTYGACGSTRQRTLGVAEALVMHDGAPVAGHITCAGAARAEIDDVLRFYWAAGVRRIVALRGDGEGGAGSPYTPHAGGYAYASDLVEGARKIADFDIAVGCYPETHPEARGLHDELDNLKRKFDAGADRAITQFFFEPDVFLRYRDAVADAGIDKPIIPGVMLQSNVEGLMKMARLCGAFVPLKVKRAYEGLENDAAARDRVTADLVIALCTKLHEEGVSAFHFYTMNRSCIAKTVCDALGFASNRRAA